MLPCELRTVRPGVGLTDEAFARLRKVLEARAGQRYPELRVEVVEDGVLLYGRTDCYYAKQLAQHVAGEFIGAPVLANRIEVLASECE